MHMFNKNDILKELAAGKSIEEIAQSAADALNEAKADYDRLKAEAEAKKKRELALQKQKKVESANSIMDGIFDHLQNFYGDIFDSFDIGRMRKHFDAAAFSAAFDETVEELKKMPAVQKKLKGDDKNWSVELTGEDAKQAGDAIEKFLRENNLF